MKALDKLQSAIEELKEFEFISLITNEKIGVQLNYNGFIKLRDLLGVKHKVNIRKYTEYPYELSFEYGDVLISTLLKELLYDKFE